MTNLGSDILLGLQQMFAELNTWNTFRPRSQPGPVENNCNLASLVLHKQSRLKHSMNI